MTKVFPQRNPGETPLAFGTRCHAWFEEHAEELEDQRNAYNQAVTVWRLRQRQRVPSFGPFFMILGGFTLSLVLGVPFAFVGTGISLWVILGLMVALTAVGGLTLGLGVVLHRSWVAKDPKPVWGIV